MQKTPLILSLLLSAASLPSLAQNVHSSAKQACGAGQEHVAVAFVTATASQREIMNRGFVCVKAGFTQSADAKAMLQKIVAKSTKTDPIIVDFKVLTDKPATPAKS
jgi:D-tyrosyl-tRNA(Tyr) deacylase